MKVCIYGAGAIGAHIGVLLKLAGVDVSLIARGAHLEAIQNNGLKLLINGEEKVARMPASKNPADLGPQDYVIIALKTHQAWEVAEQMAPLLGPDTAVVTAQNGIPWWYFYGFEGQYANLQLESVDPGGRQWNAIGPQRAIGCTVYPAAEIVEPGVVKHTYGDRYGLGEPTRKETDRVKALAGAFEAAGLKPKIYPEIRNDIWLKLWGNLCFNPISALTHATLDIVATDPGTRSVARRMMEEAETIARRIGAHFRVDIERRINGAASVGAHRTSMLQDLERGRPIELDALLTVVQEMGRLVDVNTPTIDTVLALTQQMGRVANVYPVFPDAAPEEATNSVD
ncbi:putative 2-dehydropantoate 2-reductase [Candidatus Filomicrobium marinum]|uniref:2-dehydropantoate 2-reductase n=2 Tax=Filomicrobium TaxID=119044 RepID=A0A0D6JC78_9HYPH|nr:MULTISPECIES: 2-dehydropantoate 2-reductase [Filomicrobium]MCV0370744.1 2-dehydropantoate 2-reductase [Filomicrobium sp.]CFX05844.1 putative 2-dehydropantoate 2-reductase [Candidatus Filomicrobium marinum]CPR16307.1 putative 2-dehydropantoate 2-reductase [Candidatus Filomicrobium marinum]SDP54922.1 2-dehydropantoate 2-reductase [Filomicrobium insigne]